MGRNLDVEYCKSCEDIYATYPIVWLCFKYSSAETSHSSEEFFECPRCSYLIERYSGYLNALQKRESSEFVETVLLGIQDLSDKSLDTLRMLIADFTVPSFSTIFDGNIKNDFRELITNRYVDITQGDNQTIVVLNAYKLSLMDNVPLLEKMSHQYSFLANPSKLRPNNEHGIRRKERLDALVNDFTDEERADVLAKFNHKCAFTGKEVPLHFDHVIPVAVGHGGTTKSNILPIWQRINSSKGAKNIFEWYEENGERFGVCPQMFSDSILYLAELTGMTPAEYRDYVYECHANPTEVK